MGYQEKYPLALPKGSILNGQYIIENVLGQGGFGITYEALDFQSQRRVAIKEYMPEMMATRINKVSVTAFSGERGEHFEYGKQCFLGEAKILAEFIGNESIVRVIKYFEENGTAYFVMDYIEGQSLEEYLRKKGGKISFEEVERLLCPVMDALDDVHRKRIVHRDITPDNIYITKEGVTKILDFGSARYSIGDRSHSLDVVLKHGYAPKEQYMRRGRQGTFTDVYSMGATIYVALTGKLPPDSIDRIEEDNLIMPSTIGVNISPKCEKALIKALSVNAKDRYQSMSDFRKDIFGDKVESDFGFGSKVEGDVKVSRQDEKKSTFNDNANKRKQAYNSNVNSVNNQQSRKDDYVIFSEHSTDKGDNNKKKIDNKYIVLAVIGAVILIFSSFTAIISKNQTDSFLQTDNPGIDVHDNPEEECALLKMCNVFGSNYSREQIISVTFESTTNPGDHEILTWDVSSDHNGTIMAWVIEDEDGLNLHIGCKNGVKLYDCSWMFAGYVNVKSIDFNDAIIPYIVDTEGMFDFCENLESIDIGSLDTEDVTNMSRMFDGCSKITSLDLSGFDTQNCTKMYDMFRNCSNMEEIDVSSFDTENVITMNGMFFNCISLKKIDLSGFDTSNVTDMGFLFCGCSSIEKLDVRGFDTENVSNMYAMFDGCKRLKELDVSGFDTTNVEDMSFMFCGCSSLKELDVRNFKVGNDTNTGNMFYGCENVIMNNEYQFVQL